MKKTLIALTALTLIFSSCKEEEVLAPKAIDNSTDVSFVFKQYYDGAEVTAADFGTTQYTNAKGTIHTISKLQYLVSNITLHKTDGSEVNLGGYNFIDLDKPLTRFYTPSVKVPEGSYSGVSLTFGFDGNDNKSGVYRELNAASWSWPMMIGGGYHFMKFEGMFMDNTSSMIGFAYHHGTASKMNPDGTRTHEENHFRVRLWDFNGGFEVKSGNKITIDIDMNIAEWFKNPIVWDLNQYHMMLMPNYTAQKMMNQNGKSVLKLGNVFSDLN
jgi:hypothetical protein